MSHHFRKERNHMPDTQFTPFPTDVKKTVRENAGNFDRFSKKTMEEGIEVRILLC